MKKLSCICFVSFMFVVGCGDESASTLNGSNYDLQSCSVNADCYNGATCDQGYCSK